MFIIQSIGPVLFAFMNHSFVLTAQYTDTTILKQIVANLGIPFFLEVDEEFSFCFVLPRHYYSPDVSFQMGRINQESLWVCLIS